MILFIILSVGYAIGFAALGFLFRELYEWDKDIEMRKGKLAERTRKLENCK